MFNKLKNLIVPMFIGIGIASISNAYGKDKDIKQNPSKDLNFQGDRIDADFLEKAISESRDSGNIAFAIPLGEGREFQVQVPSGFHLGYDSQNRDKISLKFFPRGESITNWSAMFAVEQKPKSDKLQQIYENAIQDVLQQVHEPLRKNLRGKMIIEKIPSGDDQTVTFTLDYPIVTMHGRRENVGVKAMKGEDYTIVTKYVYRYFPNVAHTKAPYEPNVERRPHTDIARVEHSLGHHKAHGHHHNDHGRHYVIAERSPKHSHHHTAGVTKHYYETEKHLSNAERHDKHKQVLKQSLDQGEEKQDGAEKQVSPEQSAQSHKIIQLDPLDQESEKQDEGKN
jgi:hypothetical protein